MTGPTTNVTRLWPAHARPGIEVDDPPAMRHEHAALAEMARAMLDSRVKRFPGLVAARKLDAAEADAEVELFRQISDHFAWVITGQGQPAPRQTIVERCQVLDRSITTIAALAGERGGFDAELAHQAHCVIAMRWHFDRANSDRLIRLAQFHHQLRNLPRETACAV